MEITSCELYVLDELRAAQAENCRLREKLAEVGTEPREVEMYKVNEPFETAYLAVEDTYAYSSSEHGLGMTAAEIREAVETDDGLREICEKRVGWSKCKIVDVELRVWPYQFRTLNHTYVLDVYNSGESISAYKVEMSDEVKTSKHYPASRCDELHAYGLEVARERLLKYAEKLEEAER